MFNKSTSILCVDDTDTVKQIIEMHLNELGYKNLFFANTADDAAKCLNDNPQIDLVICDINMPHKTGIDLLKSVRNHPKFKELPFIMLTVENDLKIVNAAIALGVTGYLLKPFDRNSIEKGLKAAYKKLNENGEDVVPT